MSRKLVLVTTLMFVLIGMLGVALKVQKVEANETIYIRANGSVDPSTANITTANNVTYTFTGNINDTIWVQRDNIVVDGAGYTIKGTGSGTGIYLSGRSNITIKSVQIRNFSYGIYIDESLNNNITGNNIMDNVYHGIYLYSYSDDNYISNNNLTENDGNGIDIRSSSNNSIYGNNIAGNEAGIYVRFSTHNRVYGNNLTDNGGVQVGGGIWLDRTDFSTISGNNITASTWHGVDLERASNNTISGNRIIAGKNRAIILDPYSNFNNITGNDIIDNYQGIEITGSSHHNTISGNNITKNGEGIYIQYSNYNTISGNNITDNGSGIVLWSYSTNNNISGNTITNSGNAITLTSSNNSISGNTITNNHFGITIQSCSNNTLRDNTMTNNTYNFGIWANSLQHFLNDVDDSNTVDGKPIYYWINRHNSTIPSDAGCVILVNCTNISIQNVNISRNRNGVIFAHTTNTTIAESNITTTYDSCIWLWNSSNCHVNENYVSQFIGIQLHYSSNNTIYGNTITGCGNYGGVGLYESSNNTFYGNNFTDNYFHVKIDIGTTNINNWDNGYPDGGNYWDDFEDRYPHVEDIYSGQYQNETGSDGFWDSSYTINTDNIDHYPIVPEFPSFIILPLFMIATLLAVIVCRRKHPM